MRALGLGLVVGVLSACASLTEPARELRVTEYHGTATPGLAGAPYVDGELAVDGCRLTLGVDDAPGCLTFIGTRCHYASRDCAAEALKAPSGP